MNSKHLSAMRSHTRLTRVDVKALFLALCVMVAGTASAAVTGYVSNPTTNSLDWGAAVTGRGGTINTNVNFNGIAVTGTVTPSAGASMRSRTA